MTPSGAARLKSELKKLLTQERPALVQVIAWAASNGDRSENGDYIYGKRRLREIDRRIRFLTQRLEAAEIIDPLTQVAQASQKSVCFGATVTVLNSNQVKKVYRIVGQDEIDLNHGWISWASPMAKALLNSKVGDIVQLRTPVGEEELEILHVSYE